MGVPPCIVFVALAWSRRPHCGGSSSRLHRSGMDMLLLLSHHVGVDAVPSLSWLGYANY